MASNALQKITREAKRIRKKHPGKSWKGAVKEASRRYKSGTIAGPKKSHPKKKKSKARVRPKRKSHTGGTKHRRKRRSHRARARYKVTHKVRRVGGTGGGIKTKDLLLIGGIGLAAWYLLRPKTTTTTTNVPPGSPPLVLTSNPTRDSQSQQILAWATAGGIALNAITQLIKSLNTKSDAQVSAIYNSIDSGSGVPDWALA